jgi:hypothetical protein
LTFFNFVPNRSWRLKNVNVIGDFRRKTTTVKRRRERETLSERHCQKSERKRWIEKERERNPLKGRERETLRKKDTEKD